MAIIDLHRHLGGSISPESIWNIINSQSELKSLASSKKEVEEDMTYKYDDLSNLTFHKFLQKFNILNYIRWKEKNIDYVIENVVKDIKNEGIEYCELRFSINKYLNHLPWDETEACLFVLNRIKDHAKSYDVKIAPILCLQNETAKINSSRISKLVHHWKIAEDVVGIDFVGAESHFDKKFIKDCMRYWKLCGKGLLIHAGETQSADNVKFAIEEIGVDRIAHSITPALSKDTEYILSMARANDVAIDVAITSNYYTGVVPYSTKQQIQSYHPIVKMLMHGCPITIGTDDPTVFNIDLKHEYIVLEKILKSHSELSDEEIKRTIDEIRDNSENYALAL